MARFHVSQDETGYFQLTFENDRGELQLLSDQFESPKQLIEDAVHMAESGDFGHAVVVVDPSRRVVRGAVPISSAYHKPQPRKAGA
jgi:hypothetical protein